MNGIKKIYSTKDKLACMTLDFEKDYGDRIEQFNILDDTEGLQGLARLFKDLEVPISAFIRTDVLEEYPRAAESIKMLAVDFHSHSHTHNTKVFESLKELKESFAAITRHFGSRPLGYRAPMGVLYENDIELLRQCGYEFSASVFPSFRPGRFNNLRYPNKPFVYDNGIAELPFAAIPGLRYTVSLSYLKLLGFSLNKFLFNSFGLPGVLVFDSHLHDYIVNEESFCRLPRKLRFAWGINKHRGMAYFELFVRFLRQKGYRFITMSELYRIVKAGCG